MSTEKIFTFLSQYDEANPVPFSLRCDEVLPEYIPGENTIPNGPFSKRTKLDFSSTAQGAIYDDREPATQATNPINTFK